MKEKCWRLINIFLRWFVVLLHLYLRSWMNRIYHFTRWHDEVFNVDTLTVWSSVWTWIYFIQSVETVKVDGTGRYSFTGLFSRRPALSLAVFESSFYWVDDGGLWQVPQKQPDQKRFVSKAVLPVLAVYHQLQQPQGTYYKCTVMVTQHDR